MVKELLYKWFGLETPVCASCEILRVQLELCNAERKELLSKLLDKKEEPIVDTKDLQPIKPQFVPWRVRQQMLEAEDRAAAEVLRKKNQEITELEKELGIEEKNNA